MDDRVPAPLQYRDPLRYQMLGEHGRGGLGRVFRARDKELGRDVAVKELLHRDPDAELRFFREALITARLEHPGIVSVHEAGRWPDGTPFYAMKLIAGQPLKTVIDATSTLPDRLALLPHVLAVSDAIAYAHDRKIIHRDLKPGNVLVGRFGETVVIDWGLAKDLRHAGDRAEPDRDDAAPAAPAPPRDAEVSGLDQTQAAVSSQGSGSSDLGLTAVGTAMGTPAYMPPEQARGEPADQRADVYALGAILYHTLGGRPPYADARSVVDLIAAVIAGPPTPLTRLEPELPADLVAIVDTAMARDPADRYPSARELAVDLRRFQTGQLVAVHRYSIGQLLRRWVGRHRLTVTVAAIAVLALAITGVVGVLQVRRQRDAAQAQRTLAQQQREAAERSSASVEELLDFMLRDLRGNLARVGKLDLLEAVTAKAMAYFATAPLDWADLPSVARRAASHEGVAEVARARGDLVGAIDQYRVVLSLREHLVARQPDNVAWQLGLASTRDDLGDSFELQGDITAALAEYEVAMAIYQRLAAARPDDLRWEEGLADLHVSLGDVLLTKGDHDGALAQFQLGDAVATRRGERLPDDAEAQRDRMATQNALGGLAEARGDLRGALAAYQASQVIAERIAARHEDDVTLQRDLAVTRLRVGDALRKVDQPEDALAIYQASLAVIEHVARREPSNANLQRDLYVVHSRIGSTHHHLAQLGDGPKRPGATVAPSPHAAAALAEFRAAEAIARQLVELSPENGVASSDLASALRRIGDGLQRHDLTGALASFRQASEVMIGLIGRDPSNLDWLGTRADIEERIAVATAAQGDDEAALRAHREVLGIRERIVALTPGDAELQRELMASHLYIGNALAQLDRPAEAGPEYQAALAIAERTLAAQPDLERSIHDALAIHENYAASLETLGDAEPARRELRRALVLFEQLAAKFPDNPAYHDEIAALRKRLDRCCPKRRGQSAQ